MSRLLSLSLTAMYAIAAMAISSGVASAQQGGWSPLVSGEVISNYDGAIMKVRRRRRGRWRGRRSRGRSNTNAAVAGFLGGLVGGAVANQGQRNYSGRYAPSTGNAHLDHCYSRYKSYRAYDNTFQPYGGYPRRQCISPY